MQIIQTRSDPRDLCASFQEYHQPLAEPQLDWHTARSRADLFTSQIKGVQRSRKPAGFGSIRRASVLSWRASVRMVVLTIADGGLVQP